MWRKARIARAAAPSSIRFAGDRRSRSIWQWQLILTLTVVMIALGTALLTPRLFADWTFTLGLALVVAITITTLMVPWHRVGSIGVLALPLLDALAVALISASTNPATTFLWVFPVAWIASYYSPAIFIATLSYVGSLALTGLFLRGITFENTINAMILMITLGFVGVIMMVGSERNRSTRRLLRAQSARLGHALQRVTEQKDRNRRLLNSLKLGVARVTNDGLVEISNRTFHALYAVEESAQLRPTRAVEYRERRGAPVPLVETALARAARGELFEQNDVWVFGLDGQWRALRISSRLVDDGQVSNDGVLLVVEDITQRIDALAGEDATRRTLSHELRNPLTAILGHTDLLLERDDIADSVRRPLNIVERAGTRMEQLIDRALAGPIDHRDETGVNFDLADVAQASIEGFVPVADTAGVSLDVELDESLPLYGDAFRLRQVVDNVVSNAIKYAQRGGKVTVRGYHPNPDEVALVITDTGIGISAEDIPRIFEREFRTALARERGIPGTGLGLSISRDIVVDQGGRFDVQSELGQGTEVTVVLSAPGDVRAEPHESPQERSHS